MLTIRRWYTFHYQNWYIFRLPSTPGNTFRPESYVETNGKDKGSSPLHHLISWPLTLHLVARVHTAGKLESAKSKKSEIEKAYLYRSILAETAARQQQQADGKGRLTMLQMREFLRELAWQMYSRSTDCMDASEVVPIIGTFFPGISDAEITELADVAVVNQPELTKGEETGFEFVHKSFSEYLVAERVADRIERVSFKVTDYSSENLTWRMTEQEATSELASIIGLRLLTEEVQEMIEPMLGCLVPFLKGESVDDVVSLKNRREGLQRIVNRFEELYAAVLQGKALGPIGHATRDKLLIKSPLEAFANHCAGLLIIGTSAARQLVGAQRKGKTELLFQGEPFEGAFWRCLCLLHSGGLNIDRSLASRIFPGMTVSTKDNEAGISDTQIPMKLALFSNVDGYKHFLGRAAGQMFEHIMYLQGLINLISIFASRIFHEDPRRHEFHFFKSEDMFFTRYENDRRFFFREFEDEYTIEATLWRKRHRRYPSDLIEALLECGLISFDDIEQNKKRGTRLQDISRYLFETLRRSEKVEPEVLKDIAHIIYEEIRGPLGDSLARQVTMFSESIISPKELRQNQRKQRKGTPK